MDDAQKGKDLAECGILQEISHLMAFQKACIPVYLTEFLLYNRIQVQTQLRLQDISFKKHISSILKSGGTITRVHALQPTRSSLKKNITSNFLTYWTFWGSDGKEPGERLL
jgi:hypothetical protein